MINVYDPENAPDSAAWLALSEDARLTLVLNFHRDARIPLPKAARPIHAGLHVTVENQLAMNKPEAVRITLQRLINEGLSRHDAIHAIATVLIQYIQSEIASDNDQAEAFDYSAALQQLRADVWQNG